MNLCIQLGNLTRDPELRNTSSGTAVLNCAIATTRSVPKGDGYADETTFVEFTIWGKRAEAFARFHKKGDRAMLRGRLTMDTWEDRTTGAKRSKLRLTVEEWEFTNSSPQSRQADQASVYQDTDTPF